MMQFSADACETMAAEPTPLAAEDACDAPVKRPRGHPPFGAVLLPDGTYHLPAEAVEAAAERVVRHRKACRERYAATRCGLHVAKPGLFKNRRSDRRQKNTLVSND